MTRKKLLGIIITTTVFLICAVILIKNREIKKPLPRDNDTEFASGSKISIEELIELQVKSLYKLCKVWGFTKYHHPSVVDGTLNWDAELFRVIPRVLKATDHKETNEVLCDWLKQFPFKTNSPDEDASIWIDVQNKNGGITLDTSWIEDIEWLAPELCTVLKNLFFITTVKPSLDLFRQFSTSLNI